VRGWGDLENGSAENESTAKPHFDYCDRFHGTMQLVLDSHELTILQYGLRAYVPRHTDIGCQDTYTIRFSFGQIVTWMERDAVVEIATIAGTLIEIDYIYIRDRGVMCLDIFTADGTTRYITAGWRDADIPWDMDDIMRDPEWSVPDWDYDNADYHAFVTRCQARADQLFCEWRADSADINQ
jgi:hypothetical protein